MPAPASPLASASWAAAASDRPDPPLPRGTVLQQRYRLDALLGRGESGAVYNAWDQEDQRARAVKVLHGELLGLTTALLRLRHDNRAILRIQHPHLHPVEVVTREGADSGADRVLLVSDLWYGQTLRQRLQRGPLGAAEISRLFMPLCAALQAAHHQGVVHGDLKPENLLLGVPAGAHDEMEPTLRVLDFGMHHLRAADAGIGTHPLLGTLSYLSPEQFQHGPQATDPRSDVFALGALLYECATGQPAYAVTATGADAVSVSGGASVLTKICILPTPLPSQAQGLAAGGPPPALLRLLDSVVERAGRKQPAQRLASAEALWQALALALTGDTAAGDAGEAPGAALAAGPAPEAPAATAVSDKGRKAIALFKQMEQSARRQADRPSVIMRRSAAEEAAIQLGHYKAEAPVAASAGRKTVPLRQLDVTSQYVAVSSVPKTDPSLRAVSPTRPLRALADPPDDLLAAVRQPLWRRFGPLLLWTLLVAGLIALAARQRC